MSPKDAEGVAGCNASRLVKESQSAGDSAMGEKDGLCGVGWIRDGGIMDGDGLESRFPEGENVLPFSIKEGDCGL
jgi:hypothetical protein